MFFTFDYEETTKTLPSEIQNDFKDEKRIFFNIKLIKQINDDEFILYGIGKSSDDNFNKFYNYKNNILINSKEFNISGFTPFYNANGKDNEFGCAIDGDEGNNYYVTNINNVINFRNDIPPIYYLEAIGNICLGSIQRNNIIDILNKENNNYWFEIQKPIDGIDYWFVYYNDKEIFKIDRKDYAVYDCFNALINNINCFVCATEEQENYILQVNNPGMFFTVGGNDERILYVNSNIDKQRIEFLIENGSLYQYIYIDFKDIVWDGTQYDFEKYKILFDDISIGVFNFKNGGLNEITKNGFLRKLKYQNHSQEKVQYKEIYAHYHIESPIEIHQNTRENLITSWTNSENMDIYTTSYGISTSYNGTGFFVMSSSENVIGEHLATLDTNLIRKRYGNFTQEGDYAFLIGFENYGEFSQSSDEYGFHSISENEEGTPQIVNCIFRQQIIYNVPFNEDKVTLPSGYYTSEIYPRFYANSNNSVLLYFKFKYGPDDRLVNIYYSKFKEELEKDEPTESYDTIKHEISSDIGIYTIMFNNLYLEENVIYEIPYTKTNEIQITIFTENPTLQLNLYQMNQENNRVDKDLISVGALSGTLREETSIINPVILIEFNKAINFNYVYIPLFNRYYFINEIVSVRTNLWRLSLSCDVLMSYKSDILNLECYIARNENEYNDYIEDKYLPLEYKQDIEYINLTTQEFGNKYNFFTGWTMFFTSIAVNEKVKNETEEQLESPFKDYNNEVSYISSFEAGSSNFRIVQYIEGDSENYKANLETIAKSILNDDNIASYFLSCIIFPISTNAVVMSGMGSVPLDGLYYKDTKITLAQGDVHLLNSDTLQPLLFGNGNVIGKYNNFLDYEPYTTYEIWLPFHGWEKLPALLVVGKTISVYYLLNSSSTKGSIIIKNSDDIVVYQGDCVIGVEIALNTTNNKEIENRKWSAGLTMASSVIGGVLMGGAGAMTGNLGLMSAGFGLTIGGVTNFAGQMITLRSEGNGKVSDGNVGLFSDRNIILKISSTPLALDSLPKYAKYVGRPLQENKKLNTLTGYTIVGGVHIEDITNATQNEKNEIESLLRKGIIL